MKHRNIARTAGLSSSPEASSRAHLVPTTGANRCVQLHARLREQKRVNYNPILGEKSKKIHWDKLAPAANAPAAMLLSLARPARSARRARAAHL